MPTSDKTYDGEYAYINTFIAFLEKILQMIMNLLKGTGSDNTQTPGEGDENAAVQ